MSVKRSETGGSLTQKSKRGISVARRRVNQVGKKTENTFLTKESAFRIVKPVLVMVARMIKRDHEPTVPEWSKRLGNWLTRMVRGNKHDARTPFFKRLSYEQLANMIVKQFAAAVRKSALGDTGMAPVLLNVEVAQAKKIGPKGIFAPWPVWGPERVRAIYSDKPMKTSLNREALSRSLTWLRNLVPAGSIKMGKLSDGLPSGKGLDDEHVLNTDTNSCYATYVSHWYHAIWDASVTVYQRMTQKILLQKASRWWKIALNSKSWKDIPLRFVGTAHQRTVSAGHDWKTAEKYRGVPLSKIRLVIALDKLDTLLGKPLLNNLIEVCRELKNSDGTKIFCALTTPERIDKNMQQCLETAAKAKLTVLSTDFSAYDASLAPWLIWSVADSVANWFEPKAANLFRAIVYAETYRTRCITPTGIVEEQASSMKSGCIFTNMLDSLCNLAIQRYCLESGRFKSIIAQFVQGDDGVLLGEGVNPENFEAGCEDIGVEANASKQFYEPNALSFLQKTHIRGYPGGIYPIARAFASTLSLEDDVPIETTEAGTFPAVLSLRTVMRIAHTWNNPDFVPFVEMMMEEDDFKLGKDVNPSSFARMAGKYYDKLVAELKNKPWKASGTQNVKNLGLSGFAQNAVIRVTHGDFPPPLKYGSSARFEWNYGQSYDSVRL